MSKRIFLMGFLVLILPSCIDRVCDKSDYECNYKYYLEEIRMKPPDYHRSSILAMNSDEAIRTNIAHVIDEENDYVATALLRVLSEYEITVRQRFCAVERITTELHNRGERIRSPFQKNEYFKQLRYICDPVELQ